MKGFKKLALVTAVATAMPAAAMAMQPMNDSQLAGVTGQDGIDISISTGDLTFNQIIYDRDGGANTHGLDANAGAIVIEGMAVKTNGNDIKISVDAGQASGAPVLNVNVALTGTTTINTGDLSVANTNDGTGTTPWAHGTTVGTDKSGVILTNSSINIGATSLNIQLGNVPQTMTFGGGTVNPMILISNTTVSGGINILNTSLHDNSTATVNGDAASDINIASTLIIDSTTTSAPGTDLTIGNIGVNVTANGLAIGIGSIGDATNGLSVYQRDVDLGNGSPIGDIAITGLQLSGTSITIAGH